MWKYVSRRVKDTIELGIHIRKSFSVHHLSSIQNVQHQQQQQQNNNIRKQNLHHLDREIVYNLINRNQDKNDEKFKRKYSRLNHKNKCFLNALTWVRFYYLALKIIFQIFFFIFFFSQSTALITGFYTAQLLCLYKRKQRYGFGFERSKCYYSKYLESTSQSIHQNVRYLLTPEGQQSLIPSLPKLGCPFRRGRAANDGERRKERTNYQKRTVEDELYDFEHFIDPGYKQYEKYFERPASFSNSNLYNVSNETPTKTTKKETKTEVETCETNEQPTSEDVAIDEAIRNLAYIVGEFEVDLGIESLLAGDYKDAVDHFKLSSHHNHPGGLFNLASCYEQGIGVNKNMNTAKRLYEIASSLGHAKALYNLGVFHAQGLGGLRKNFDQAKKFFDKAAELGNDDAIKALSQLIPKPKKTKIIEDFQEDEHSFKNYPIISSVSQNLMKRVAVAVT